MACGSTYAHLLRTEDGKTPDDPWDWYPGPFDYDEWYDVAHYIGREVWRRWDFILATEDRLAKKAGPGPKTPYPERDQLLFLVEEFGRAIDKLGHPAVEALTPTEVTWQPMVDAAIAVGRDGVCLLEQLDEAARYYEQEPLPDRGARHPPKRRQPGASGGSTSGALVTGVLLVGGVVWWRHRNKRRQQTT
ncbi:MAG: hypothetical protein K0V04_02405 [Deltaproteobacteria bacterium]|nr:hypothetical protein [Deltaproteobacteria bacterium]